MRLGHRSVRFLAAAAASLSCGAAMAALTPYPLDHTHSSIVLTQTADINNASISPFSVTIPGSAIVQTAPSSPQLSNTFSNSSVSGKSTTAAVGGAYQVTNSSDMEIALTAGTGISQNNVPGEVYSGPSQLDVHVDALWTLTSGFPQPGSFPGVSYQFPIAGTVGINGVDHFILQLNLYEDSSPSQIGGDGKLIGSIDVDHTYTNSSAFPAAFTDLVSGIALVNNGVSLAGGSNIEFEMLGDIIFKSKNDESPSSFYLTDDSDFGGVNSSTLPTANSITDITTIDEGVPEPAAWAVGATMISLLAMTRTVGRRVCPA
jgi:hypothetical protein